MATSTTKKTDDERFQYSGYQESEQVKQAQALLQQQLGQKPGAYQSQWQTQLNDTLNKILNREQFSYDVNSDALYQQYKDQYVAGGRMAMLDTMGQAQAMTGGYGNSYAQSVGQQAYQSYLQGLNDRIPELYNLALSRYTAEGDAMNDRYALLQQQENQAYGMYQDQLNAWLTERDYLQSRYDSERDYDYSRYADDRDYAYNQFINDRNYQFQVAQAEEAKRQWQAEFDEALRQYNEQMALQKASTTSSSGGTSGGGGDTATIKAAQEFVGTTADGVWGPNSKKAAAAMGYSSLEEVIAAMGGTQYEFETGKLAGGTLKRPSQLLY